MEDLELIIAALVAGTAAGANDVAGSAVRDAYAKLRKRLSRKAPAADLDAVDADGAGSAELRKALVGSGAVDDPKIREAARRVLTLSERMRIGRVEIKDSTGIQVGDHGSMTLHINDRPRKRR